MKDEGTRMKERQTTKPHTLGVISLGALLLLLLAGCSVHQAQEIQPLELPGRFTNQPEITTSFDPKDRWWEAFGDPGLNRLMDRVFADNLDLVQAEARLAQAEALARQSRSGFFPSLSVNGQGGRQRQPGMFGPVTENTYQLSLAASYEIDLWGRIRSRAQAALSTVNATRQELNSLYITLAARTADLYFLAVEQQAQIELTDQTIASFADSLERVERRYRAGLVSSLDVYQSRQNLAAARQRRPVFVAGRTVAENMLALQAAQPAGLFAIDRSMGLPDLDTPPPSGVPSSIVLERPDVRAALNRVRAADARVGEAVADRFPAFSLTGAWGGASDTLSSVLDSQNIFWNLLLNIAMPILDGGRRAAEADRTRAVLEEQLAAFDKVVLTAFKEIEDGLVGEEADRERIKHLQEQVEAAADAVRLAEYRYVQGLSDYLPVLTAQISSYNAQSNLIAARRALLADRISLLRAMGGQWPEIESVKDQDTQGRYQ